jgi:putative transposase
MKKQFTEEQIIKAITRLKKGEKPKDLGREYGVSPNTLYNWKKRFKDMTVSEAKRLRELEAENSKLKRLVAEQALDIVMLKDINSRKW